MESVRIDAKNINTDMTILIVQILIDSEVSVVVDMGVNAAAIFVLITMLYRNMGTHQNG